MSLWQRKKSSRRKPAPQRARLSSTRLACEPLESRRMLTLLGVAPQLVLPSMTYDSNGHIAYSQSAQTFDLTATPLTFRDVTGPSRPIVNPRSLTVHIQVDHSGNLIGGV